MHLKNLDNPTLHQQTQTLAAQERRITLEVLHHLRENESRMLYAEMSYPSLFEYCVRELKYSAAQAQRRISAMRLLRDIPQVETHVREGRLHVSQLAQVQTFLRAEKKLAHRAYTPQEKLEVTLQIAGLSTRETERRLVDRSPAYAQSVRHQMHERALPAGETQLTLVVDAEFTELLESARTALAYNGDMNPKPQEVIKRGLRLVIQAQHKRRGFVLKGA